jgi:hypothetical protein
MPETPKKPVDTIIERMTSLYEAPRYLRGNKAAMEAALSCYRQGLERFDQAVLEQAWQKAVEQNEMWCWPTLQALVSLAEKFQPKTQPEPWVERANDLADAYHKHFMKTSRMAMKARTEGWAGELSDFIRESAWVQAQILVGRERPSYSGLLVSHLPNIEEKKEAMAEFLEKARVQASKGYIQVRPPGALIERWREAVGQERGWNR